MNTFILLIGAPGSGKSTWVKENGLEGFAISADTLRLMYSAPIVSVDGTIGISNKNDKKVWITLWNIIHERMNNGSLTILDTCGLSANVIGDVKGLCRKFGYKLLVRKFDDSKNLELLIDRNTHREEYKKVPLEVIESFHKRYLAFDFSKYELIDNWSNFTEVLDGNKFENVYVLGDIHGCINTLELFFSTYNLKKSDLIIFTGDLIDRGLHNAEVILKLMSLENAIFIKGNHDRWLCYYANKNDEFIKSDEFISKTSKELNGIPKEDLQWFCNKFVNSVTLEVNGVYFFITHGGTPSWYLTKYKCSSQLVNGVGRYQDIYEVDKNFSELIKNRSVSLNIHSIHGHRNPEAKEVSYVDHVFNLEGKVEYGGELRFMVINAHGFEAKSIPTHKDDIIKIEGEVENE